MNLITLTNLESKTLAEYPAGEASKLAEVVI
jgi:hypothetical protein